MNLAGHIEEQARHVDRNPSDPQKAYGNYKKGHIKLHGLDISIENPRGSWRTGGPEGKKWKARLPHHYGYIRKTEGGDGDHVDCFVGPHLKAPNVFVIDQHNLGKGGWDEHKCMIGFGSKVQAREAYNRAFSDGKGRDRIGHIEIMTINQFRDWLKHGDTTKSIKSYRKRFADGGPVSDDDQGAMSPETYVNPVAKGLVGGLGSAAGQLATLPQRAFESVNRMEQTGEYDPAPIVDAAMLPMGGGFAGAGKEAGVALGSGMIPGSGPEAKAAWSELRQEVAQQRAAAKRMTDAMQEPVPEHVDPFAGMNDEEKAAKFESELRAAAAERGEPVSPSPSIRAYHGSPHDFDTFDLSKIGTGEGAQAYGHGLYFAENKGVANAYRNNLTEGSTHVHFGNPAEQFHPDELTGADNLAARGLLKYDSPQGAHEFIEKNAGSDAEAAAAHKIVDEGAIQKADPGRMYEVNINADPEHFLDWDKPLSEQHPKVQEAMIPILQKHGLAEENTDYLSGTHIINRMGNSVSSSPRVSNELREAGLPGIRYLDQVSRGTGEGSRNYVVFNDKLIDILKKYGIAAAAAPGMAQEIMNQGKQHFASGGRVGMADGGVPAFDETRGADAGGPPAFDEARGPDNDVGGMTAALRGAEQGATFGFSDELSGLNAAGPKAAGYVPGVGGVLRPALGAARIGYQHLMGGDQTATTEYEKARDEARAADELAKQQHPYLHMAGELAGSIPAMAVLPEGEFAGAGPFAKSMIKGAQVGAEYGGLSGAGEGTDTGSRALGAAQGIVSGIVGGAASPVIGKAASAVSDRFISPAIGAVRGAINPEAEASRRLAAALQADQDLIRQGKSQGMSWADWGRAYQAGEPVTLADLGSSNTQALLRSSANTSPEGRAILEKQLGDRFAAQTERVSNEVRGLVAGGANAGKTAEDLVADYDKGRKPLYKQAYTQGDKQIMSPSIEQMMGSPSFTKAMRGAVSSGQDRAVTEGYGAFNPGVTIDPGGSIRFNKGPTGVPIFPNLQYWDSVKRELDDMAGSAMRSGEKGQGGVLSNMANTLRSELDKQVPSYADARGFASKFFGESNALEAGRNLAGKKVDPAVITSAMQKMKPDEQNLFQEGYASDWANRVISNISDSRDITKAMFNSPNERARAAAVFGQGGLDKMQTRMTLETIMDGARKAMGNSTTARQLIEAGLAGGTLEGYLSGWDPTKMAEGAAGAAGARKFLGSELATGARQLVGKVDSRTARLVAELLTSNDPTKLAQGMRMAQKNQKISQGLKNIANRVSLAGQQQAAPGYVASGFRALQGPVPAGANQEQQ